MEKDYIAPLFNQTALEPKNIDDQPYINPDLIDSLLENKSPISRVEAGVWRLRSIYIYLFSVIYIVWLERVLRGHTDQPWLEHINQSAVIGRIPGTVVFFLFAAMMLTALSLSLFVTYMDDHFDSM